MNEHDSMRQYFDPMGYPDFPYPGEKMTASQNDLLAIHAELVEREQVIADYVVQVKQLETELSHQWRREQMIGDRE